MKSANLFKRMTAALVFAGAAVAWGDGLMDGVIDRPYGATRARDEDSDGACVETAQRGDVIDLHAFCAPAGGTNEAQGEWSFAFVVDSSFPLNATSGDFFGQRGGRQVTYLLGIDVGCDDQPRFDMNAGTPWRRFFGWGCDYFVGMFATGPDSLYGILYNANKQALAGFDVKTRVLGYRRHIEFKLPAADANIPPALKENAPLCLLLVSTYNTDGGVYDGGRVIDAVGQDARDGACNGSYVSFQARDFVRTMASAKTNGTPLAAGPNTRQSTSWPRRDQSEPLRSKHACGDGPSGIRIDGVIDAEYTHLTEAGFAGPYRGGSTNTSDYVGESAAFRAHYASNGDKVLFLTGSGGADLRQVYAHADTNYLYLIVNGPDALGWMNEPDYASLFVAIDSPRVQSGTGLAGGIENETRNAPAGRAVNFKGWDPDFAVELFFRDYALLWSAAGGWSGAEWFGFVGDGKLVDTKLVAAGLYYGRVFQQYEFAIPWSKLGGRPAVTDRIRIGAYTTGDENIGQLRRSNWDVYDQAPGIGQGCNGFGAHERIGDDPFDNDSRLSPFNSDGSPYVGRTDGYDGLPNFWQPASDIYNKYDPSSGGDGIYAAADLDTIEEYFEFTVDPNLFICQTCEWSVQCPGDQVLGCGETVPDLRALVVISSNAACGAFTVTQAPAAGTPVGPDGVVAELVVSMQGGASHTCSVRLVTQDDDPPVLAPAPADIDLVCGPVPPPPELNGVDACSGTVSVSFVEFLEGTGCVQALTRIWMATDDAGNTASATQTVRITSALPLAMSCPQNLVLHGTHGLLPVAPDLTTSVVVRSCGTPQVTQSPAPGSPLQVGTNVVVVQAVDACGEASCAANVVVVVSGCTRTQGYWKNHPERWTVTSLTIGGVTYNQAQLLAIFATEPNGDATYILIHQLIAALLNAAAGADTTSVDDIIRQAQEWLEAIPPGTNPEGKVRQYGIDLAATLDRFNNGEEGPGHCE
jgi:hypothetical protein